MLRLTLVTNAFQSIDLVGMQMAGFRTVVSAFLSLVRDGEVQAGCHSKYGRVNGICPNEWQAVAVWWPVPRARADSTTVAAAFVQLSMAANDIHVDGMHVADQSTLEEFSHQPANERKLTESLRGVLAETACTGVIRYEWPLLRELVAHQLGVQLKQFEAAEHVDIGPARPLCSGDGDLAATVERFTGLLEQFRGPPWTLQRLCELILEPRKQYQRLHKLILALEKLLLVTGEVEVTPCLPPAPLLDQLTKVNETPAAAPAATTNSLAGQKRPRPEDAEASGLVTAALKVTAPPGHVQAAPGDSAPAATAAAGDSAPAVAAVGGGEDKENDSSQQAAAPAAAEVPKQVLQESQQEAAADAVAATTAASSAAADSSTPAGDPAAAAASERSTAADTKVADAAVNAS